MIDQTEYRRVIGHFATGVTVVTTADRGGAPAGLTVNAVSSVSLSPVLLLVCIERSADSFAALEENGVFAVNVLGGERGETLARRFAEPVDGDRFRGVAYRTVQTGAPVLHDAIAWLDCRVDRQIPAGDHDIFIGEVLEADAHDDGNPLLYYRGGYGGFRR